MCLYDQCNMKSYLLCRSWWIKYWNCCKKRSMLDLRNGATWRCVCIGLIIVCIIMINFVLTKYFSILKIIVYTIKLWCFWQIELLNKHLFLTAKPVIYLINLSERDFIRKKNKWYVYGSLTCLITGHTHL